MKPRSEIVNTFSHSPIFRATTAQPLVKNHASSSPTRIGASFRRPLRHSIVRFRAPTTPERRKRNDHVPLPMCLHVARATRSPPSASRFLGTHAYVRCTGIGRRVMLLRLLKSCTLPGGTAPFFLSRSRHRLMPTYSRDYMEIAMLAASEMHAMHVVNR